LIYKARTPPRCNASIQLHMDLHFTQWINCKQKYNRKEIRNEYTYWMCRFITWSYIQAWPTKVESTINLLECPIEWSPKKAQELCESWSQKINLSVGLSSNSVISFCFKTDFKSSAAVINGLGIYLIDYHGCIFIASVQCPHIIY